MAQNNENRKFAPVRTLPAEVARKIAAGEVIERPASILRELLDNAVDSGADMITAEITGGGIERLCVTDNGCGMSREDLEACARPHTTSKITAETDLLTLTTLGFRGEALASIAAVSRLEITSMREGEKNAWKAVIPPAGRSPNKIIPASRTKGTTVQSEALFENIPARRLFLKRPASETNLCRQIFIEKALARTDISFRFICDGKTKYELPAGQSYGERFVEAFDIAESPRFFSEITGKSGHSGGDSIPDWKFRLILGNPSVSRSDKRLLLIYVNGRRVQEFSLVQAIEYGATGYFPNGTHPAAILFLDMKPSLVDFNIHPAKKEVRFKDISEAHHAVSSSVRNFYMSRADIPESSPIQEAPEEGLFFDRTPIPEPTVKSFSYGKESFYSKEETSISDKNEDYRPESYSSRRQYPDRLSFPHTAFQSPVITIPAAETDPEIKADIGKKDFRYLGQVFSVFLAVQKDDSFYLIDQHAAHERILFDKFMAKAGLKQALLLPYKIVTESDDDDKYIESISEEMEKAGFTIKKTDSGWEISTVPQKWQGTEDYIKRSLLVERKSPSEIIRTIAAYSSCRAAVMEGDYLDRETAEDIIEKAFRLPDPHCPHGRPVWIRMTKESLYALVKRT
ncbi:MAG: DNA mismatch repair endonuclease MutL [Treponemataceae bacterium]|nr:DNA mismatch repair endonuclease MutL [Treponemataceae bacterium]